MQLLAFSLRLSSTPLHLSPLSLLSLSSSLRLFLYVSLPLFLLSLTDSMRDHSRSAVVLLSSHLRNGRSNEGKHVMDQTILTTDGRWLSLFWSPLCVNGRVFLFCSFCFPLRKDCFFLFPPCVNGRLFSSLF